MSLKTSWKKLRAKLSGKPEFLDKGEYRIIPAFKHGGIQYYRYDDVFNTPCVRALASIQYYEEFACRMTREYQLDDLKAHQQINAGLKKVLSGSSGQLNLIDAIQLLGQSNTLLAQKKQRLEWIFEPEALYNLAAVVYFDRTENPMRYDAKYAKEKIALWKVDNAEMLDFFLQQPILRYAPSFKELNTDFHLYLEAQEIINKEHLEKISEFIFNKS
jgi:hypothetical protein